MNELILSGNVIKITADIIVEIGGGRCYRRDIIIETDEGRFEVVLGSSRKEALVVNEEVADD